MPASATVGVEPAPDPTLDAPTASAESGLTPVHAEISTPPETDVEKFASTANRWASPEPGEGKFCTFAATYVAIEIPPALTNLTSL